MDPSAEFVGLHHRDHLLHWRAEDGDVLLAREGALPEGMSRNHRQ